jgi:hypothetical protein
VPSKTFCIEYLTYESYCLFQAPPLLKTKAQLLLRRNDFLQVSRMDVYFCFAKSVRFCRNIAKFFWRLGDKKYLEMMNSSVGTLKSDNFAANGSLFGHMLKTI